VFGRLLPRETSFFDFFEKHVAVSVEGAKEFLALANGERNVPMAARRINEIEHEADTITHRCKDALHKTFITPIDRNDIFRLISRMDDIMDAVEAASERMHLYEINACTPEARELAVVLVKATELLQSTLRQLRDLKHVEEALKLCVEIHRLENEADAILRIALARLFKENPDPIAVMKWKEIYEYLEESTDRCEEVAVIIEGIFLEHA
jgi:hypothetical protein